MSYKGLSDKTTDEPPTKLGLIVDAINNHGAHIDYANYEAEGEEQLQEGVKKKINSELNNMNNTELKTAILGSESREVQDILKKKMSKEELLMAIKTGQEHRKPQNKSKRRLIGLALLSILSGLIIIILITETKLNGFAEYIRVVPQATLNGRKDVYLVRFNTWKGLEIHWNDTQALESDAFLLALAKAFSQVPYNDYSIEWTTSHDLSSAIEIAFISENSGNGKITVKEFNCDSRQKKEMNLELVSSITINRCLNDQSSSLKNSIKCKQDDFVTSKDDVGINHTKLSKFPYKSVNNLKLMVFLGKILSGIEPDMAYNTRCCDFDQVYDNLEKRDLLEVCKMPIGKIRSSDDNMANKNDISFLQYYEKEDQVKCSVPICSCHCFSDINYNNVYSKIGCPKLSGKFGKNLARNDQSSKTCQEMLDFLQLENIECQNLPTLAKKNDKFFATHNIELGSKARCYGQFHTT